MAPKSANVVEAMSSKSVKVATKATAKAKAKQSDVLSGLKSWAGGDDAAVPSVEEPPLLGKVGKSTMKKPSAQVSCVAQFLYSSNRCVDMKQISQSYTLVL